MTAAHLNPRLAPSPVERLARARSDLRMGRQDSFI